MAGAYLEKKKSEYKKKDGTIVLFYRVRYGHNQKRSKSFKKRDAAIDWRDEFNAKYKQRPTAVKFIKWTLAMLANVYKEDQLGSMRTGKQEEAKIDYLVKHYGDVKLIEMDDDLVRKIKRFLAKDTLKVGYPRSPRTVNAYLVTLRTILNYGLKKKYLTEIPDVSSFIDKGKEKVRDNIITPAEFLRLVAACDEKRQGRDRTHLKLVLIGLYYTGARRAELQGIRFKDIDLKAGIVTINNGKRKDGSIRKCFIAKELRTALIADGFEEKVRATPDAPAFGDYTWYKRAFATAKTIAGIDSDFRLHDLRRCAITNMLQSGFTPHVVQAMVGHTSKSTMTLDVYRNLQPDFIRAEGEKFDLKFGEKMEKAKTTAAG